MKGRIKQFVEKPKMVGNLIGLTVLIGLAVWCLLLGTAQVQPELEKSSIPPLADEVGYITKGTEVYRGLEKSGIPPLADEVGYITERTEVYRGFVVDNVLHSANEGDIHYNVYIPESYDGSTSYALYLSLIHI